ncbi:collagen alpha-1(I) chain-like [Tiliqua scincoides]|uniref:collagen alpha-1(I) chain-like n=1 Tax=Tiliqua scincoides TaxID=71010 RepID=UPI0034635B07
MVIQIHFFHHNANVHQLKSQKVMQEPLTQEFHSNLTELEMPNAANSRKVWLGPVSSPRTGLTPGTAALPAASRAEDGARRDGPQRAQRSAWPGSPSGGPGGELRGDNGHGDDFTLQQCEEQPQRRRPPPSPLSAPGPAGRRQRRGEERVPLGASLPPASAARGAAASRRLSFRGALAGSSPPTQPQEAAPGPRTRRSAPLPYLHSLLRLRRRRQPRSARLGPPGPAQEVPVRSAEGGGRRRQQAAGGLGWAALALPGWGRCPPPPLLSLLRSQTRRGRLLLEPAVRLAGGEAEGISEFEGGKEPTLNPEVMSQYNVTSLPRVLEPSDTPLGKEQSFPCSWIGN